MLIKLLNNFSLSIIILFITSSWNAEAALRLKLQCKSDDIYSNPKEYVLNKNSTKQTQIYFLRNTSNHTLGITHSVQHVGASAGWYSYLSPGNWSAIAVQRQNFSLRCYAVTPQEKNIPVNCSHTIKVCQAVYKFKINEPGNYWLAENQPWSKLLRALSKRGVYSTLAPKPGGY